jgi:N6-adenosine-specific RNA methylase IME4
MSVQLIRYDAACRALAAAKTVNEAGRIRNVAEAMRAFARQAKNRQLELDAAEIRIRAERRVGELIKAQKAGIGLGRPGVKPQLASQSAANRPPELKDVGVDHKLSARAQQFAAVPAAKFEALVGEWRDRIVGENDRVTTNLLREGAREQTRTARPPRPLPPGRFHLIYADPPWQYEHIETESRAIENQYPTMTLEAICGRVPPAADDAVLFLWATSPKLLEAMRVIEAWGFVYRTCAVWDKETIGMGYYFRQQHELLLVGARGALPVPDPRARVSSVIRERRGRHSEKPVRVYDLLETMYPSFTARERIELFSRGDRPGWTHDSNEPHTVAL